MPLVGHEVQQTGEVERPVAPIELDEAGEPDDGPPRREALCRQLTRGRHMRRHPWLPALMATRPLLGPNALARSERVYALLHSAGLSGPRLTAAVGAADTDGFFRLGLATILDGIEAQVGA